MFKVILNKGFKGEREWQHATKPAAEQRAQALAHLHSCSYEWNGDLNAFIVKASAYYNDIPERTEPRPAHHPKRRVQ